MTNLATTLLQCSIAEDCEDTSNKLSNHVKGLEADTRQVKYTFTDTKSFVENIQRGELTLNRYPGQAKNHDINQAMEEEVKT